MGNQETPTHTAERRGLAAALVQRMQGLITATYRARLGAGRCGVVGGVATGEALGDSSPPSHPLPAASAPTCMSGGGGTTATEEHSRGSVCVCAMPSSSRNNDDDDDDGSEVVVSRRECCCASAARRRNALSAGSRLEWCGTLVPTLPPRVGADLVADSGVRTGCGSPMAGAVPLVAVDDDDGDGSAVW